MIVKEKETVKSTEKPKHSGRMTAAEKRERWIEQKRKKTIGYRLTRARQECGYSQMYVSKVTGISQSALANYENDVRIPNHRNKIKLSAIYKVSVQKLFYD